MKERKKGEKRKEEEEEEEEKNRNKKEKSLTRLSRQAARPFSANLFVAIYLEPIRNENTRLVSFFRAFHADARSIFQRPLPAKALAATSLAPYRGHPPNRLPSADF